MHAGAVFATGLVVGAAAGAGAMLAAGTGAGDAPLQGGVDHSNCKVVETRLRTQLAELQQQVDTRPVLPAARSADASGSSSAEARPPTAPATPAPPATTGAGAPRPASAGAATAAADAHKQKLKELRAAVRAKLNAIRDAAPGSAEVLALMNEWRTSAKGDDPDVARYAGLGLLYLARRDKLRPEDADLLIDDFSALPAGAAGRPGLAGAVARIWARDQRLAGWLAGLPVAEEPEVRSTAIWSLDETPSQPYRDWVVRLTRSETDPGVVRDLFDEDIIAVTLTRSTAPQLAAAIEPRIAQGDLDPKTRARGYLALGLIAQQDPVAARAAMVRLAGSETDPGVRAFAEGVVALIDREESNIQALEGLWDQTRPSFGK